MKGGGAETVAIIGAGIGGVYLSAELGIAEFKLRLHDIDNSKLSEIRAGGGLDVEGDRVEFAPVDCATTDLGVAVDGADVIIVVTGANAQAAVARSLAPRLQDGQAILLIQGNTGGALIVRRALDDAGCRAEVDVAEMDNYPYSCWSDFGNANTSDRQEAVAADRHVAGEAHWGSVSTAFVFVPGSGRRAEYPVHRVHQRQRDAARGELRR